MKFLRLLFLKLSVAIFLLIFISNVIADTPNIERIQGKNPIEVAVSITQFIYPTGADDPYHAGVVILVNKDDVYRGFLATELIHHPRNGPILYTENNSLPNITKNEILRLQPTGIGAESQIIILGDENLISANVENELKQLNFSVKRFRDSNVFSLAAELDKSNIYQTALYHKKITRDAIILSYEDITTFTSIAAWSAHWDTSFLFVTKEGIPKETLTAIAERNERVELFIVGSEKYVSESIVNQFRQLDKVASVERIEGNSPDEFSVNFNKFKKDDFGWGYSSRGGVSVSIASVETLSDVMSAISASILGHLGKHSAMITLPNRTLTKTIGDYLLETRPFTTVTPATIRNNHAFVVGDNLLLGEEGKLNELIAGDVSVLMTEIGVDKSLLEVGDTVKLTVHLHNTGPKKLSFPLDLIVNEKVVETKNVELEASENKTIVEKTVFYEFTTKNPGTYIFQVGEFTIPVTFQLTLLTTLKSVSFILITVLLPIFIFILIISQFRLGGLRGPVNSLMLWILVLITVVFISQLLKMGFVLTNNTLFDKATDVMTIVSLLVILVFVRKFYDFSKIYAFK